MLWPVLGGIRFYLALIVAGAHLNAFTPPGDYVRTRLEALSPHTAVFGFFILSGFSIAASLAKNVEGFYFRRALRILPLYLLAIMAGALCLLPFGGHLEPPEYDYVAPAWTQVMGNLFFLQGFFCDRIMANAVVWTLSIEVFLYLCAPFLKRLSFGPVAMIAAASAVIFILSRSSGTPHYSYLRYGAALPLMAWPWLIGFLAFRLQNKAEAALMVLSVSLIAITLNPSFVRHRWIITLAVVSAGIGFAGRLKGPAWLARFLDTLGDISYPLYLFHIPVYLLFWGNFGRTNGLALLGIAVATAAALDFFYDGPIKAAVLRTLKSRAVPPSPIADAA
ncbi:MAG: acyltransferase 3 [Verrucomicrobia bacterium]|nr:acyltransferase 3 [Verrucomicrobiota bacterium]